MRRTHRQFRPARQPKHLIYYCTCGQAFQFNTELGKRHTVRCTCGVFTEVTVRKWRKGESKG